MTTLGNAPWLRSGLASWPLTPIEELDLYLESAAEPSLIQLETVVPGHLDRDVLQTALADVLAADPATWRRLAATSQWHRRLHWEAAAPVPPAGAAALGLLVVANWRSAGQLSVLREWLSAWPIPLLDRPLRLILAAGPEHDVVILQTHHAAFDGISSLSLLSAISAAYRERGGNVAGIGPQLSSPPAPRSSAQERSRGAGGTPAALTRSATRVPGLVARVTAQTGRAGQPGYGAVRRSLPVPRPASQGSGPVPTVNDVLVAALIIAVNRWNGAHGQRSGRIRISVPLNERDPRSRWAGPGNQTRLIRVTAPPGEPADPARLLAHVTAQTRAAKQRPSAGLDAASRLLATGWAPAVIKRRAARLARRVAAPVCTDTALLSNLGAIPCPPSFSAAGPGPLWFSGPSQMPRGLGVGALTIEGQLHLCVNYRHALLDQGTAAAFTALYCQALGELAGRPA